MELFDIKPSKNEYKSTGNQNCNQTASDCKNTDVSKMNLVNRPIDQARQDKCDAKKPQSTPILKVRRRG